MHARCTLIIMEKSAYWRLHYRKFVAMLSPCAIISIRELKLLRKGRAWLHTENDTVCVCVFVSAYEHPCSVCACVSYMLARNCM